MVKWLKENAVNIIMFLVTIGSGIGAFANDAGAMFATFPLQAFLLVLFVFMLGGVVFRFVLTQTRHAEDKRILEKVNGLSPQLLSAIHLAYRDGVYTANVYDPTAQYLLGLGFLGAPSQVPMTYETPFILQPWFKNFLDKNFEKVFGKQ